MFQIVQKSLIVMLATVSILSVGATSFADTTRPTAPANGPQRRFDDVRPGDDLLNDVYVRLYLARFQRQKTEIESAKVILAESQRRREREEYLLNQSASSPQEVDIVRREVDANALRVQVAEAQAEEAKSFLDIAVTRISLGLEMPICAELR